METIFGEKLKTLTSQNNLTKKNENDAGLDILSNEDCIILANNSHTLSTDLFIAIPQGYVGLVSSRSGLSIKHEIEVGAGVIDSDYRGEVKVHLYNYSCNDYVVKKGDRIAQLLTVPILLNNYIEVDTLSDTVRGSKGLGSSGK